MMITIHFRLRPHLIPTIDLDKLPLAPGVICQKQSVTDVGTEVTAKGGE